MIESGLGERKSSYSGSDLRESLWYVESPNDARPPLADFFSVLLEMDSVHGLHCETPRTIHLATAARFRAFGQRSPSQTASMPQRGVGSPRWCLARDRPTCTRPPAPAP